MLNFFKRIDLEQVKEQISDIKDQVDEIQFRKPWTIGSGNSTLAWVGLGAVTAVAGILLYRNRKAVAEFCAECGTDLKEKLANSPLKEKAGKIIDKVNGSIDRDKAYMENYQPT